MNAYATKTLNIACFSGATSILNHDYMKYEYLLQEHSLNASHPTFTSRR